MCIEESERSLNKCLGEGKQGTVRRVSLQILEVPVFALLPTPVSPVSMVVISKKGALPNTDESYPCDALTVSQPKIGRKKQLYFANL